MPGTGHIIFVNRFYWPDEPATGQLLTDLAEALVAHGYRVTVIASHPAGRDTPPKTRNGVEIVRVPGLRFGRRHLLLKSFDFLSFALGARRRIRRHLAPGDTLVMMTDPPLLGTTVVGLARRRQARLIHWIQDIYPEIAVAVSGLRIANLLRPWRDRAWHAAAACVTLGEDMAAFVRSRGVPSEKIRISPNWAPAGLGALPADEATGLHAAWNLADKFVVAYSGNLGRVHELDPIIDIADALRDDPAIAFLFIGDGAQKQTLAAAAAARGLANIQFHCPQPRTQLGETLALADLHLVTLRENCTHLVFPSKLYGIAAAARPVLFIGPAQSEIARTVAAHGFGLAHPRHETAAAASAIRALRRHPDRLYALGLAAEKFWHDHGRLEISVRQWQEILGAPMPLAAAASRAPQ